MSFIVISVGGMSCAGSESARAKKGPRSRRKISPPFCSYFPFYLLVSDFRRIFRDENRIPTVLITDLDHGAQISEMTKKEPKGTRTVSRGVPVGGTFIQYCP